MFGIMTPPSIALAFLAACGGELRDTYGDDGGSSDGGGTTEDGGTADGGSSDGGNTGDGGSDGQIPENVIEQVLDHGYGFDIQSGTGYECISEAVIPRPDLPLGAFIYFGNGDTSSATVVEKSYWPVVQDGVPMRCAAWADEPVYIHTPLSFLETVDDDGELVVTPVAYVQLGDLAQTPWIYQVLTCDLENPGTSSQKSTFCGGVEEGNWFQTDCSGVYVPDPICEPDPDNGGAEDGGGTDGGSSDGGGDTDGGSGDGGSSGDGGGSDGGTSGDGGSSSEDTLTACPSPPSGWEEVADTAFLADPAHRICQYEGDGTWAAVNAGDCDDEGEDCGCYVHPDFSNSWASARDAEIVGTIAHDAEGSSSVEDALDNPVDAGEGCNLLLTAD